MDHESALKPRLRGVSHGVAALAVVLLGAWLVSFGRTPREIVPLAIYAVSLTLMYGISALYHLPDWSPGIRIWWRRADHAAIFILIAGTATPFCKLALPPEAGHRLLWTMWLGAGIGVGQSLFWPHAPKALAASLYLALGWLGSPYLPVFFESIGFRGTAYVLGGGLIYTAGALVYALKKPDPWPRTFGYHEVFHALVILGSIGHFLGVYEVVLRLSNR
jgi:hemolysin III